MRDPRYDCLFEPVQIGPVTARNRFYQVPHCCGMGYRYPNSMAAMRGVKAEGGWAVVCTEEVEIHHTSDLGPYIEGRIWDEQDMAGHRKMTEAVHEHGSLAGCELVHNGAHGYNRYSREVHIAPSGAPVQSGDPAHARAMDRQDIANLRRWFRNAALRARDAEFDIVYVYAAHDMTILQHFLSARYNHRSDEYGGSLENRARLLREVIEDARDAVGDRCAIAVRLAVDELLGDDGISSTGEGHDTIAMLAELPDLWDVNISGWDNDSQTARFSEEGFQEPYIKFVKSLTTKPVVGVGRYTSPDAMVRVVKQGVMDLIGAARPSIADPFLPAKIEAGRIDDIRECIGCNICVSGDMTIAPIRCTQNPTIGEEWRRGWHPETIRPAAKEDHVLIVGGGPAGLEAARALGQRGLRVTLAEAGKAWGGRSAREARLPGLSTWKRVADWRIGQLHQLANVELYLASRMNAGEAIEVGADHIVVATGCRWLDTGAGRTLHAPLNGHDCGPVLTPDQIVDRIPNGPIAGTGRVVIYDDDGYYMGGIMAEICIRAGLDVALVTPTPIVSPWTENTLEQHRIQTRLLELGVAIHTNRVPSERRPGELDLACTYSGRTETIACDTLVPVAGRAPVDDLHSDLTSRFPNQAVSRIGDCLSPATIAAAVYSGHRFAREYGESIDPDIVPFKREDIVVS